MKSSLAIIKRENRDADNRRREVEEQARRRAALEKRRRAALDECVVEHERIRQLERYATTLGACGDGGPVPGLAGSPLGRGLVSTV